MMNSLASSLMFPLELEREIFMTAAIIHEETIPTLLRVAHRVLVWQAVTTIYVYIIVVLFITRKAGWSAFFSFEAQNRASQNSGCVEVKLVAVPKCLRCFVMQ
jgi:hypothetical protein